MQAPERVGFTLEYHGSLSCEPDTEARQIDITWPGAKSKIIADLGYEVSHYSMEPLPLRFTVTTEQGSRELGRIALKAENAAKISLSMKVFKFYQRETNVMKYGLDGSFYRETQTLAAPLTEAVELVLPEALTPGKTYKILVERVDGIFRANITERDEQEELRRLGQRMVEKGCETLQETIPEMGGALNGLQGMVAALINTQRGKESDYDALSLQELEEQFAAAVKELYQARTALNVALENGSFDDIQEKLADNQAISMRIIQLEAAIKRKKQH